MKAKLINTENRIVLISPGFNCSKEVDMWYNSIKVQNYPNWIAIAIDDMSTDDTFSKLMTIASKDSRVTVVRNLEKKYQLRNWYDIIMGEWKTSGKQVVFNITNIIPDIENNDIIMFSDLDDWFGSKYVFEDVIKEYIYRDILILTCRNFQLSDYYHHDAAIYEDREQLLTDSDHKFSLFTYRAILFKLIPDILMKDNKTEDFYQVCGDYAITSPMMWIAGPNHHQHLFKDYFVIYNNIRPLCDDNKFDENGVSLHEIARKEMHEKFMEYRDRLEFYDNLPRKAES